MCRQPSISGRQSPAVAPGPHSPTTSTGDHRFYSDNQSFMQRLFQCGVIEVGNIWLFMDSTAYPMTLQFSQQRETAPCHFHFNGATNPIQRLTRPRCLQRLSKSGLSTGNQPTGDWRSGRHSYRHGGIRDIPAYIRCHINANYVASLQRPLSGQSVNNVVVDTDEYIHWSTVLGTRGRKSTVLSKNLPRQPIQFSGRDAGFHSGFKRLKRAGDNLSRQPHAFQIPLVGNRHARF